MRTMTIAIIVLSWLVVGAGLGLYEARRGHWHWLWLLGAVAGPLAIPITRELESNERFARPVPMSSATGSGPGAVRLLAGVDGSDSSITAARLAANLLGSRLGSMTLAVVATFEVHEKSAGELTADDDALAPERRMLESAAADIGRWLGFDPATVVLSGAPDDALRRYAADEGFDVVAVGSRGRGLSTRLLGSCAAGLAGESSVPTLIMPVTRTASRS